MGNMPASLRLCHIDERAMSVIPHKFYDTPFCVVSLNVVRDTFLLIGDLMRSVQFIRYYDPTETAPATLSGAKDSGKNKFSGGGGNHYINKHARWVFQHKRNAKTIHSFIRFVVIFFCLFLPALY
jgi:hypothetical protein